MTQTSLMQFIEKNTKLHSMLTIFYICLICLLQICLEKSGNYFCLESGRIHPLFC